ncbi:MAG: excinuclease ABC subunit UvrC [Myxococcales bacterium]|nr:excinuclease ABC subunit UvrC [Myxococcales bacterium]MCB9709534.1 excinuclease ABC subunit UvrC [Myxococcales bacterium]
MKAALQTVLASLPAKPGVYIFRDRAQNALYVGKALNLRSRTRSYFHASSHDDRLFIPFLEHEVDDIETIVVRTEKEAALLEHTLIRQLKPKYNVKLRDDKEYLSLRLDPHVAWPRLETVRRPKRDGAYYFGPYHSASSARRTLRLVNRHFKLRTCTDTEFRSRVRPCLQYQIKRCPAPCVYPVDAHNYHEQIKSVALFLNGKHAELSKLLDHQMHEASTSMQYELAATYRDQLKAVALAQQEQQVSVQSNIDQDVVHFFREQTQAEFAVLLVRNGKLNAVRSFALKKAQLPDSELLSSFVAEYYEGASYVPHEVLLPQEIELMQGFSEMLSEQRGSQVRVRVPKRGAHRRLLQLAADNAEQNFMERKRLADDQQENLTKLQALLQLPSPPRRIECIDVSHSGGDDTVAAIVVMTDGVLDRAAYRTFHIRASGPSDDYAAMFEALSRRFRRGKSGEDGWELPDLVVVDGGRGQIKMAQTALKELGLTEIRVIGVAKEREDVRGELQRDRIYVQGRKNPIALRGHPEAVLITRLRDEAHRSANRLREHKSTGRTLNSELDAIKGVGIKTRTLLLRQLGSMARVRAASLKDLYGVGLGKSQAKLVHDALHPSSSMARWPKEPQEAKSQTELRHPLES